jgi:hypothetical protein
LANGQAVFLNRELHDADLVLPIGCCRGETSPGYYGIHGGIYPLFSDRPTVQRYRSPGSLDASGRQRQQLIAEADETAWLLGVMLTVQVVPAARGAIRHVVVGEARAVERRCRQLYDADWGYSVPRRARLVVAAVEGNSAEHTWHNLGRALATAANLVEEDGAIAVCCDLQMPPGAAVQHLAGARSRASALRHIRRDRPADALPAAQLIRALDRSTVYLLSRLEPSLVEDLDMVPVSGGGEIVRLASQFESCILVSNAPHVEVAIASEAEETA